MKTCKKSNIIKNLDDLSENKKDKVRKYYRDYYQENKDLINKRKRELYEERHKEKIRLKRSSFENKVKKTEYNRQYKKKNKQKIMRLRREYQARRRKRDPLYNLKAIITSNIVSSLKRYGYTKRSRTYLLLGASFKVVKDHLEETWFKNYGTKYEGQEVHIDHIIPTSSAKTVEELIKLQHYTNLQYLTPEDNQKKSNKINQLIQNEACP